MAKSTKKSGSTRIATEKFAKMAEQLGLTQEAKAGWILMFKEGNRSQRLLVHTGKRGTNCIELVGFESEFAIAHPCPPAKTMTQLIDFNIEDPRVILRNVFKTAKLLAVAKVEAEPAVTEAPAAPEATTEETPAEEPVAQVG